MGGATLHLGGGDWISEPIYIPCHVCNMRVHGGTLRASPSFPANSSHMIESAWGCAGVDNAGGPSSSVSPSYCWTAAATRRAACTC